MRFLVILNRDGGTLRTMDLEDFSRRTLDALEARKHKAEIQVVDGRGIVAALDAAAGKRGVDVVMVGGGDGTISAAATRLMGKTKALAVLPAGTMNLFARSLKIPLALDEAVEAFASGRRKQVDIATANGRPFIHQFSVGMHAKMVQLREEMEFGSRLGKIGASARAAIGTIKDPPLLKVTLDVDGDTIKTQATGIGITNNLLGEGHLPYADKPAGGVLGVYVTSAIHTGELLRFAFALARGKYKDNQHVELRKAHVAALTMSRKSGMKCVIDGELARLDKRTEFAIHPKALRVLVPGKRS